MFKRIILINLISVQAFALNANEAKEQTLISQRKEVHRKILEEVKYGNCFAAFYNLQEPIIDELRKGGFKLKKETYDKMDVSWCD